MNSVCGWRHQRCIQVMCGSRSKDPCVLSQLWRGAFLSWHHRQLEGTGCRNHHHRVSTAVLWTSCTSEPFLGDYLSRDAQVTEGRMSHCTYGEMWSSVPGWSPKSASEPRAPANCRDTCYMRKFTILQGQGCLSETWLVSGLEDVWMANKPYELKTETPERVGNTSLNHLLTF